LKPHDGSRAIRQQIDNLALAFVTPLSADNDDILTHNYPAYSKADQTRLRAHEVKQ
jgi:hypothetical protein